MVDFGQGPIEEAAPVKRRVRKYGSRGPLDIPREMIPTGVDLQWVSDTINGQPCPEVRSQYEVNAWEPVTQEMFDGRFDGMFMRKGQRGEINVSGMVLMWRPIELTIEAQNETNELARRAVQATESAARRGQVEGLDPGFADQNSPAARANTRVVRTYEPGAPIPR